MQFFKFDCCNITRFLLSSFEPGQDKRFLAIRILVNLISDPWTFSAVNSTNAKIVEKKKIPLSANQRQLFSCH